MKKRAAVPQKCWYFDPTRLSWLHVLLRTNRVHLNNSLVWMDICATSGTHHSLTASTNSAWKIEEVLLSKKISQNTVLMPIIKYGWTVGFTSCGLVAGHIGCNWTRLEVYKPYCFANNGKNQMMRWSQEFSAYLILGETPFILFPLSVKQKLGLFLRRRLRPSGGYQVKLTGSGDTRTGDSQNGRSQRWPLDHHRLCILGPTLLRCT